jgi:hypothetical protein
MNGLMNAPNFNYVPLETGFQTGFLYRAGYGAIFFAA